MKYPTCNVGKCDYFLGGVAGQLVKYCRTQILAGFIVKKLNDT